MKPEVLIVAAMMSRVMDTLATEFTAHRLWEAADQAALLASIGPRIRGIATTGGRGAEAKLIASGSMPSISRRRGPAASWSPIRRTC